jgi:hypothetical protein
MLIPKEKSLAGIIIECKKAKSGIKTTLERSANTALKEIKTKNYAQELRAQSIYNIIAYAVAFHGKKLSVRSEKV